MQTYVITFCKSIFKKATMFVNPFNEQQLNCWDVDNNKVMKITKNIEQNNKSQSS